jgi:Mg-chelatase subunit ChlI
MAAEERFEGVGFFRAGLGVQDEALQFTHQKSPQVQNRRKFMATIACRFVRIGQMNFVNSALIPREADRYSAAIRIPTPSEISHEKSPVAQWRQKVCSLRWPL